MRVGGAEEGEGDAVAQQYRLYFLDDTGRITSAPYEFEADGDETAVKLAEAWREGRRLDLWCGGRRLELPGKN